MRTKHQLILDSRFDPVATALLDQDLTPSYIPEETRRLLLETFKHTCAVCGKTVGDMHIDHIIPVARGGKCHYSNLQVLCRTCNLHKSCHGIDPRSYELGYVIPIIFQKETVIRDRILDIIDDPRY